MLIGVCLWSFTRYSNDYVFVAFSLGFEITSCYRNMGVDNNWKSIFLFAAVDCPSVFFYFFVISFKRCFMVVDSSRVFGWTIIRNFIPLAVEPSASTANITGNYVNRAIELHAAYLRYRRNSRVGECGSIFCRLVCLFHDVMYIDYHM